MRARKDPLLDLVYGLILSIILIVQPSPSYDKYDAFTIEFFKSLCVVAIIFIWLSSITKEFKISPFIEVRGKDHFDIIQLIMNIRDLLSAKIAVIIFVFTIKYIFGDEYFLRDILLRPLQASISVIYVMTLYLILNKLKRVKHIRLWLVALIVTPYFIVIFLHGVFNLGVVSALLLPTNLMVLSDTFTISYMCIYLVGFFATSYLFVIQLRSEFSLLKKLNFHSNEICIQ